MKFKKCKKIGENVDNPLTKKIFDNFPYANIYRDRHMVI